MSQPGNQQPDLDFAAGESNGLDQWRATVHPEISLEPLELYFASGSEELAIWRGEQAEKLRKIALREGLPIGEEVRVVLESDLELVGRLLLDLDRDGLKVGSVTFAKAEIRSCVRSTDG